MSEKLETLFDAARQLPLEEQRMLAEKLIEATKEFDSAPGDEERSATPGKLRHHFGAWDSGDVRSADNEEIDRDLAREFASTRESEA